MLSYIIVRGIFAWIFLVDSEQTAGRLKTSLHLVDVVIDD